MDNERVKQLARDERLAARIGLGWGFAEGLFFFVVPDVYVTSATLFSLRAGLIAWMASIAGSLVAVVAIYFIAAAGLAYVRFLAAIPGISWTMLEHVKVSLGAAGLPYTPLLITGGVPLKVYAGMAFSLGIPLGAVLVWTVFARIVRIAPVFAIAAAARLMFHQSIDRHALRWCALLAGVWTAFYVFYWMSMGG